MVEIGKDFIIEEGEFFERAGSLNKSFRSKEKSGGNHVMSVSWLKPSLFMRDVGFVQGEGILLE